MFRQNFYTAILATSLSIGIANSAHSESAINSLTDLNGQAIILHGVNSSQFSKNEDGSNPNHDSWETDADLNRQSEQYGHNAVRYLIFWDRLMPEDNGVIDQDYVHKIKAALARYQSQGMKVILDMHQDIWGSKCGYNGAPNWASNSEDYKPGENENFLFGALSECYRDSFNDFWANHNGVQDKYVSAWAQLANDLKDEPALIGYDIMNEPGRLDSTLDWFLQVAAISPDQLGLPLSDTIIYGLRFAVASINLIKLGYEQHPSESLKKLISSISGLATQLVLIYIQHQNPDNDSLPENLPILISNVADTLLSSGKWPFGIDGLNPDDSPSPSLQYLQNFEKNQLTKFYQKAIDNIRKNDRKHWILIEPNSTSVNMGSKTFLGRITDPVKKTAYAPHMYPLISDRDPTQYTPWLKQWFDNQLAYANENEMPLVIGEFGANGMYNKKIRPYLNQVMTMAEQYRVSWFYWVSDEEDFTNYPDNAGKPNSLASIYVENQQGMQYSTHYEHLNNSLTITYQGTESKPVTLKIKAPKQIIADPRKIRVQSSNKSELTCSINDNGYIQILDPTPIEGGIITLSQGDNPGICR